MNDKVTPLPGIELPTNLLEIAPRPFGFCAHGQVRIDEHSRTVHCVQCSAVLDPFSFIVHNARTMRHAWDNYRQALHQLSDLVHRVDGLKREEKRLKASVKRLRERSGEVIDMRGRDG